MRRLAFVLLALVVSLAPGVSAQSIAGRAADIRIGGRLHTQYAASSVGSASNDFFFRRARIIADIGVTDFFDARFQTDFAGGKVALQDAYVRFGFSSAFRVSMGQFKRAFDLFELASSTDLSLIERDGRVAGAGDCSGVGGVCSYSRLTEKLELAGRDAGIRIDGSSGNISYMLTATNGTGANNADENDAKSYSGRVTVAASDDLRVSGQFALHDYVDPDDENQVGAGWGLDVEYGGWRDGLLLQAAVAGGDNWKELDSAGSPVPFTAFQGVVSYYVPVEGDRFVGVEPLARLSFADPNGDVTDDGGVIFTPGLMFYISGKNKIGMNLDVYSPQTGDTEYSFKVQSFLYF